MMGVSDAVDSEIMKSLKKSMTAAGFSDEEQDQIIAKAEELVKNPKTLEEIRKSGIEGSQGDLQDYRDIIDSHLRNMLHAAQALDLHPEKFMMLLYVHVKDMVVQTFGEDRLNAFESCITTLQGETHVDS